MTQSTQFKIAGILCLASAIIHSYKGGPVWLWFILGALFIWRGCSWDSTEKKMGKFLNDKMDDFINHYNKNKQ